MEIDTVVGKEITFVHNTSWWPERKLSKEEIRFNEFIHENGIPYLMRICKSVGITVDRNYAGTMGVSKGHIGFSAYNLFGAHYYRGCLDTHQKILDFSFEILGDKIKLN